MSNLLRDLRYSFRSLRRSPGFTTIAVLTLALGIGTSTALFTAVDALILRPLPVHDPERLVEIRGERAGFGVSVLGYAEYETLRDASRTLTGAAATTNALVTLGDADYAETLSATFVSGGYFPLLGLRPALGRLLAPADDRRGAPTAGVVLSHRLWQSRFGGDPAIIGATVRLNNHPVTILGVMPRSFAAMAITGGSDLWAPLALHEEVVPASGIYGPMSFSLSVLGRLRPGTEPDAAARELSDLARQNAETSPGPIALEAIELRGLSRVPARYEGGLLRFVTILGVATTLLLLIAAMNVAGMLLARATVRHREIALRAALGARRGRLVRELVADGVVLSLLGAAAGILLALWLTDLAQAFRWPGTVAVELVPNTRVLGFALAVAFATGIGLALAPAWQLSRTDLTTAIKGAAWGGTRGGARLRNALVPAQVALAVVLLGGAGLFLRALGHALSVDPGFDPAHVEVATIDLHRARYDEPRGHVLYDQLLERVTRIPGVEAASLSAAVPLGPGGEMIRLAPAGIDDDDASFVRANVVTPDFFRALRIPLLRGRAFTDADRESAPRVAIVNESIAREFWPGEDPLGKRFRQSFSAMALFAGGEQDAAEFEVVGVVADGRDRSLRDEAGPRVYLPLAQSYRAKVVLAVRVAGGATFGAGSGSGASRGTGVGSDLARGAPLVASAIHDAIRTELRALDPSLPRLAFAPLEELIADALVAQRIGAILTTLFGVAGLLLTAVGLYGVLAFTVAQRTREIGVRIALGAERRTVIGEFLRRGGLLAGIGAGIGIVAAVALSRTIEALLFGVSAYDPVAYIAVVALLFATALLASWIPARRAARVDPMVALREE
jgi:predicted permease